MPREKLPLSTSGCVSLNHALYQLSKYNNVIFLDDSG